MPVEVTNLTPLRSFDADSVSIDELANILGTLIEDVEAGDYLGSEWSVANGEELRDVDLPNSTLATFANLLATIIADNPGEFLVKDFNVASSFTVDFDLDCSETSLDELNSVFASLLFASLQAEGVQLVGGSAVLVAYAGKRFPIEVEDVFESIARHVVFEAIEA